MQCIYRVIAEDVFKLKPPTSGTHRTYWLSIPRGVSVADTVANIIADIRSKDDQLDKLQLLGHGDFGVMTIGEEWNLTSIAPIHLLIEGSALRVYPDGTWDSFIGGSNE